MLMNKTFLSSSANREVAMQFARHIVKENNRSILYICHVNDDRAALAISAISCFSSEQEVLILSCMDFEITKINEYDEFVEVTLFLR